MPPMNILGIKFLGRPIKPVAFALSWSMIIIAWAAFDDVGVLDGSRWADALGVGAIAVSGILVAAWWKNSQQWAEIGLAAAFFLWTTRFLLILLVNNNPITQEGLWLSLGWVVIAGGSYLLEKDDTSGKKWIGNN